MQTHHVTWWNVENLFDVLDSCQRPSWLQSRLKSELRGWDANVLNLKIQQLASVLLKVNNGKGPDILGLCEVENKPVLDALVAAMAPLGRNYTVRHHDCQDQRGIDIAFVFDADRYSADEHLFHYEVIKRSATRDIVQVTLTTRAGNELVLIGNHWPSRVGGAFESEPFRILAGETLSYWMERIRDIKGKDVAVLVMGDFNDEPHNRSLTEFALSSGSRKRVVYARNPMLYNLMWPLLGENTASYYDGSRPVMLDQFLVSKGMVKSSAKLLADENATWVERYDELCEGRYNSPKRFGRPSSSYDPEGFSDHFPISTVLKEKI